MKNIKILPLIICLLLFAFMIVSPTILINGMKKNVYTIRAKEAHSRYKGVVTLWHVVDWKTGRGAGVNYLKKCASAFEKDNVYFFIEIEGLTPEQALEKLQAGIKPDIISYPTGFFENPVGFEKLDIDQQNVHPKLIKSGMHGQSVYGASYMHGGYMLFANNSMLYNKELDNFDESGITNYAFNACLKNLSFTEKRGKNTVKISSLGFDENALIPEAGLSYHVQPYGWDEDSEDELMIFPEDWDDSSPIKGLYKKCDIGGGYDEFIKEKTAMLVGTQSTYSKLEKLSNQGKGPDYIACALSPFTDEVQYFSIYKTDNELKYTTLCKFIEFMQSKRCQAALEDIYVFPVIAVEDIYDEDYLFKSLYEMQQADLECIPAYFNKDYVESIKNIMKTEFN